MCPLGPLTQENSRGQSHCGAGSLACPPRKLSGAFQLPSSHPKLRPQQLGCWDLQGLGGGSTVSEPLECAVWSGISPGPS